MNQTTTSNITNNVDAYYDRTMLMRVMPNFVHRMFAQTRPLPRNSGSDTIRFRRYNTLSTATTPLVEGQNPVPNIISNTDITAQIQEYGAYAEITSKVDWVQIDPYLTETAELQGDQAGQTLDEITRDVLAGMLQVFFPGSITDRANITSSDKISTTLIKTASTWLKLNNAKKIKKVVKTTSDVSTFNIRDAFVAIVHPYTTEDLQGLTGWKNIEDYPKNAEIMEGEIGSYGDVRFIESSIAKVYENAGSGGAVNVYKTMIFAQEAYGVTQVNGEALKMYRKPLGSAGAMDALNRYGTMGWVATFVAKRLNEDFMCAIEHATTNG